MKKHYLILWIDDDPDSIRTDQRAIEKHLKAMGVVAKIEYSNPTTWSDGFRSETNVMRCLEDPELDIILMDYNLDDGFFGKDIIAQLRVQNIFVPIVYYSQQHFDELQKSLNEENVDGVFVTHRSSLEDRTFRILDSLLKREHKVRRMRGLLLSDASELEAQGAEIAERCWNLLNEDQRNTVRHEFEKYMKSSLKGNSTKITNFNYRFEEVNQFWELRFFDASKRGYLIQKIFNQLGWGSHANDVKLLCGDAQPICVFKERNQFAHQTELKLQQYINDRNEINFPKELRDELHKAEANLQDLLNFITEKEAQNKAS